jgi:hypothetical protein
VRLLVHDPRTKWIAPALDAARRRNWIAEEYRQQESGYLLYLVHANPGVLALEKRHRFAPDIKLITDATQIQCYEDKRAQINRWKEWMPDTWVFSDYDDAMTFLGTADYPLVSKADVGASSVNVRIIASRHAAEAHAREIWGPGIRVEHCDSMGTRSVQKDYAIFQRFIAHDVTWRVNAIGRQRAVFKRYCYPDRAVAQTGNVEPVKHWKGLPKHLLGFADAWLICSQSRWCAIDILWDEQRKEWRFLECSLRWPWPSPGECGQAQFWIDGKPTRKWEQMWDVMMDELEAGAFG